MEKSLNIQSVDHLKRETTDVEVVGNPDRFQLLCKASSKEQGWMKSTKAMQTSTGCVVQVTTQQRNPDDSYAIAEALTYVPGVVISEEENGGRWLVAI